MMTALCEACGCSDVAHGDENGDNRTCDHNCTGWFLIFAGEESA